MIPFFVRAQVHYEFTLNRCEYFLVALCAQAVRITVLLLQLVQLQ